ncbi:gastrula zinc finger protein XlCGF48.2-like isoform X2 [Girardinichthys multiradiatus]|uniref:gastrula zinc finger protein XlCGF48.2-like isoform X2 n=1 Tax=Girardinichthys multiradiatus TaxID=208333 RepID=UPI001FAC9472|nr:gastrula zinc finger protein XlCGF48.2-like isoform X2 [Girardinichthys multiradiatus]
MSFPSAFGTQVAAIMDVLAKAAVAEITMLVEEGSVALRLEVSRRDSEIQELRSSMKRMETELQKAQEAAARRGTAEKQVQTAPAGGQESWRDKKKHHEINREYTELTTADSLCEAHIRPAVKREPEGEFHFGETSEHAVTDAANRGDPIWSACDKKKHHEINREYTELTTADSLCEAHIRPAVKREPEGEFHFGETSEHAVTDAANRDKKKHHEINREYTELTTADSLCEAHISPAVKREPEGEFHLGETSEHAVTDAANRGDPIWSACGVFEKNSAAIAQQSQIFPSTVEEYSYSRDMQSSYSSSGTEGAGVCFSVPVKAEISVHPELVYKDHLHPGAVQDGCMESAGPLPALRHAQASTAGASGSNVENFSSKINCRSKRFMTVWRANQSVYICSMCNKSFLRLSLLEEHKSTHHPSKPFRCLECGKSFTQKTRLKTHQWVHTGERPFSCSICGKKFSRQDNCLRHERFHS